MMLNTKSADSAMFIPGISPQLGSSFSCCAADCQPTRVNKINILVTWPLGYLPDVQSYIYIHTIVVQAARVQISCIPGMIITRFFRAVLSARSFYGVWDLSDLK